MAYEKLKSVGRAPRDVGVLWSIRIQVAESEAAAREQERTLTRAASAASTPAFAAIWNNPDDDAYDAL